MSLGGGKREPLMKLSMLLSMEDLTLPCGGSCAMYQLEMHIDDLRVFAGN